MSYPDQMILWDANSVLDSLPDSLEYENAKNIAYLFPKSHRPNQTVQMDYDDGIARLTTANVRDIFITYSSVNIERVKLLLEQKDFKPLSGVRYKYKIVLCDGHERLVAQYLLHKSTVEINLVTKKK